MVFVGQIAGNERSATYASARFCSFAQRLNNNDSGIACNLTLFLITKVGA
jgi:hypothetical protein